MEILKFYKIIKIIKSLRKIKADAAWLRATRKQLEALVGAKAAQSKPSLIPRLASVLVAAILIFGLGALTIFGAQAALPNEPLFPVKILVEKVQGLLIFNDSSKAEFALNLAQKRLEEAGKTAEISLAQAQSSGQPQATSNNQIVLSTINRAQNNLEKARGILAQISSRGQGNGKRLDKIFERLEKLEEKQLKLAEKFSSQIPGLSQALNNVAVSSVGVEQQVDKIIITFNLAPPATSTATTSTSSVVTLSAEILKKRAQKAIERAERKIIIVEAKLKRFEETATSSISGAPRVRVRFEAPGFLKKLKVEDEEVLNELLKEFEERLEEATEKTAEAKEKLAKAKEEFNENDFGEAIDKANEAFKLAVRAEGLISNGKLFLIFPSVNEPETATSSE